MNVLIVAVVLFAVPCSIIAVVLGVTGLSSPPQVINVTIEQMAVNVDQRQLPARSVGDELAAQFQELDRGAQS